MKIIALLTFTLFSLSALADLKVGQQIDGEFEVVSEYGEAAIYYKDPSIGIFVKLIAPESLSGYSLAAFNHIQDKIKFRRPITTNIKVKGKISRGLNALGTQSLTVEVESLEVPGFELTVTGQVREVTYWQGALRIIDGGRLIPLIAANGSDFNKVDSQIERVGVIATQNGIHRTFARIDGHIATDWGRRLVMAVHSVKLVGYDEARKAGYRPHGMSSDVQMTCEALASNRGVNF